MHVHDSVKSQCPATHLTKMLLPSQGVDPLVCHINELWPRHNWELPQGASPLCQEGYHSPEEACHARHSLWDQDKR